MQKCPLVLWQVLISVLPDQFFAFKLLLPVTSLHLILGNMKSSVAYDMRRWSEYCGNLRGSVCTAATWLNDPRKDRPMSVIASSPSSSAAASEAGRIGLHVDVVSSSCEAGVKGRLTSNHINSLTSSEGDFYRKHVLGLKKCFHCPHCRYSTDRKNNLKRHLSTMHRDSHSDGGQLLDQSNYHVTMQKRSSCHSCVEHCSFNRKQLAKRQLINSDLQSENAVRPDNTTKEERKYYVEPLPSHTAAGSDDVRTYPDDAGTKFPAASAVADCRSTLPRFEPRSGTAYRRHSSRMFFYDRLRCTHNYTDGDQAANGIS